jgi:hypothetical protein
LIFCLMKGKLEFEISRIRAATRSNNYIVLYLKIKILLQNFLNPKITLILDPQFVHYLLNRNSLAVSTPVSSEHGTCPKCGKALVKRKGPRGKSLGCAGFPVPYPNNRYAVCMRC